MDVRKIPEQIFLLTEKGYKSGAHKLWIVLLPQRTVDPGETGTYGRPTAVWYLLQTQHESAVFLHENGLRATIGCLAE